MNTGAATVLAIEWKDYGPFVQGTGAVIAACVGALIAGRYLLRNSKKTPYEHLDLLTKARAAWPDGRDGLDSIDRSIDYALAQIRAAEGDTEDNDPKPTRTAEELNADLRVAMASRRLARSWLMLGAGISLVYVLWIGPTWTKAYWWGEMDWAFAFRTTLNYALPLLAICTMSLYPAFMVLRRVRRQIAAINAKQSDDETPPQLFDY
ncbi:hypothetical protein [Nocardia vinacea]|uniref:hypothetical protein n=1 Tax=Nocardia vinacea TaxID=96468 RepID=UPI000592B940|nr:hypothetical protein [Nocardia vinacea]